MVDSVKNKFISFVQKNNILLQINRPTLKDNKDIRLTYTKFIDDIKEIIE